MYDMWHMWPDLQKWDFTGSYWLHFWFCLCAMARLRVQGHGWLARAAMVSFLLAFINDPWHLSFKWNVHDFFQQQVLLFSLIEACWGPHLCLFHAASSKGSSLWYRIKSDMAIKNHPCVDVFFGLKLRVFHGHVTFPEGSLSLVVSSTPNLHESHSRNWAYSNASVCYRWSVLSF